MSRDDYMILRMLFHVRYHLPQRDRSCPRPDSCKGEAFRKMQCQSGFSASPVIFAFLGLISQQSTSHSNPTEHAETLLQNWGEIP
jgi:hypothetical protein